MQKPKIIFFCVPSVSVCNTLLPVIEKIAEHYELTYFNTLKFSPAEEVNYIFKPYPDYKNGYNPDLIDADISYFEFALRLLNTADALLGFLKQQLFEIKPQVIIISHLALWGKLAALNAKIPLITLFSTFVLREEIVTPVTRRLRNSEIPANEININAGIRFLKKLQSRYSSLNIKVKPSIWDAYINQGDLNIVLLSKEFQPLAHLLNDSYYFIGSPLIKLKEPQPKSLIYISLGTVMNNNPAFYNKCIKAVEIVGLETVISIGNKIDPSEIVSAQEKVHVVKNVDQRAVLQHALIFISHGGMASVQEAVASLTPLIIIPMIPEQVITSELVTSLGIGIKIMPQQLTETLLATSIRQIIENYELYLANLKQLRELNLSTAATDIALKLIIKKVGTK